MEKWRNLFLRYPLISSLSVPLKSLLFYGWYLSCLMTKPTKWSVRPAKTRISLGIRPVWSESLQCAQCVAEDPVFLHVGSGDSDQIGRIPRLIWVFAGCTDHSVGFCHEAAHIGSAFKKQLQKTKHGSKNLWFGPQLLWFPNSFGPSILGWLRY